MKYSIKYILIVLILIPINGLFAQQSEILLDENFTENTNNWDNYNTSFRCVRVWNGKYSLITKKKNSGLFTDIKIPINQNYDFSISATLKYKKGFSGDGYGLCYGKKNKDNNFTFTISENGIYEFGKWENGKWLSISRNKSAFINKNGLANKIGLVKIDDKINFYINDEFVENQPFENFFGKNIGFVIYNKMTVEISNIIIRAIADDLIVVDKNIICNRKKDISYDNIKVQNLRFISSEGTNVLKNFDIGEIIFSLYNPNKKPSVELRVLLSSMSENPQLLYDNEIVVKPLKPKETVKIVIPIKPAENVSDCIQKLRLQIVNNYGLAAKPQLLDIELKKYRKGKLEIVKYEIDDKTRQDDDSFMYGNGNGIPEYGESFRIAITLKNTGNLLKRVKARIFPNEYNKYLSIFNSKENQSVGDLNYQDTAIIFADIVCSENFKSENVKLVIRLLDGGGFYYDEQLFVLEMNKPAPITEDSSSSSSCYEIKTLRKDTIIKTDLKNNSSYAIIIGSSVNDSAISTNIDAINFYSVCTNIIGIPESNIYFENQNRFTVDNLITMTQKYGWLARMSKQKDFKCVVYFSATGSAQNNLVALEMLNLLNPKFANRNTKADNIYSKLDKITNGEITVICDVAFSGLRNVDEICLPKNEGRIIISDVPSFKNQNITYVSAAGINNYSEIFADENQNLFSYYFNYLMLTNLNQREKTLSKIIEIINVELQKHETDCKAMIYGNQQNILIK